MPDKDGDDEKKSTKSVVNKRQKQMMGEEGYDIARDMGKVSPSKDKKDATTIPVSDEVKKTQKKSKGKSAVELVKAKYGKSVMNMGKKKANEELDLSKVAEAFGGYIVNEKLQSLTSPDPERLARRIIRKAEKVSKKREQEGGKQIAKELGKKFKVQGDDEAAATQAAKDIGQGDLTPDVRKGMQSVAAGKGKAEPQDPSAARSGSKVKGTPKASTLKPTTRGRRITKKIGKSEADEIDKRLDAKSDPKQDAKDDARLAGRKFKKDFKKSGVTGDIGFTAPDRGKKIQKRLDRADKLGTPDPFSVDTSTAASDVTKDFGAKPVAGGLPMDPTRKFTTTDRQGRKITKTYDPSQPQKRESIPKDSGALSDRPKILKKFSDMSKKIKDLKKQGTRDFSTMNPSERQRAFGTSSTEGGAGAGGSTAGGMRQKGGALVPKGGDLVPKGGELVKTVDAVPVKQSMLAKSAKEYSKFVKNNPVLGGVTGLAAYDLGKGILSKIMKLRGPGVQGGRAGFRSAGG